MIKPYYQDLHNTLYNIDFRENDLPDESIQCVVTSPPYWGLRKYSGEQDLIWGGEKDCVHQWVDSSIPKSGGVGDYEVGRVGNAKARSDSHDRKESNTCSLCGAWRGAYGLEPTPEMYIQHTISILREIRRVLRKDGVVFWNIGDTYSATRWSDARGTGAWSGDRKKEANPVINRDGSNLPAKNLCLIPFRVAIAAQEDGWWVRSVIIWSKPNPMPESVTDRPTESHEYILMLTKSKKYYWDADAVREGEGRRYTEFFRRENTYTQGRAFNAKAPITGRGGEIYDDTTGPNLRSVWNFPTQPYPEAHFAVFPEKLPEICIKAATPEVGCCSKCGAPWTRVLSKGFTSHDGESKTAYTNEEGHNANQLAKLRQAARASGGEYRNTKETLGWQPTCKCNADKVPSLVLDPFAGAGTTLWAAKKLNRRAIGFDTSEEYCRLTVDRLRQQVMM